MHNWLIVLPLLLAAQVFLAGQTTPQASAASTLVRVPFVGCESDVKAPNAPNEAVRAPGQAAQRLAYYKAEEGPGVLAPRGWHCFGTYGSNGTSLYVSPDSISREQLFSTNWKGFTGPVIQVSSSLGDTSGRFEVAKIIARVFPAYKQFVESVIAEGIEPASSFPFGAFPRDHLRYISKRTVEFETLANADGLGTTSRLQKKRHSHI